MARLFNSSRNIELAGDVRIARSFFARMKGLLGERALSEGRALWIENCNSIHTWFMHFAIDVVFVDRHLVVRKVCRNVKPWRLTLPAWRATSVFEMPAGTLSSRPVEIGDQLHVGD